MKIYILVLSMVFFMPMLLYAQSDIEISASLNKAEIAIGDEIILTVTVKQRSGGGAVEVGNAAYPDLSFFEELGSTSSTYFTVVNGNAQSVSEFKRTFVALQEGVFNIASISVPYRDSLTGKVETAQTEPIQITVQKKSKQILQGHSPRAEAVEKGEDQDFSDTRKHRRRRYGVAEVFAFIAVLGFSYALYRQKKRERLAVERPNAETVSAVSLPTPSEEHFFELLSNSIKNFLGAKYGISEGKSTSEFLGVLKEKTFFHYNEAREVLETCDRARFGKAEADKERLLALAKKIAG